MGTGGDTRGTDCKKWPASCAPLSSIWYGQSQKQSPWAWRMKALTGKAFLMLLEQPNCGERQMFSRTNYQINKKQIPKKLHWAETLSQSEFAGFFCFPQPNENWFLSYLNTLNGLARQWLWHLLLTCVHIMHKQRRNPIATWLRATWWVSVCQRHGKLQSYREPLRGGNPPDTNELLLLFHHKMCLHIY